MVSEDRVMNQARQKANELVAQAEVKAKEVRRAANEYCEDALRRTEEAIQAALDEVKESRVRFRATSNEQMQANQEKLRERRSASQLRMAPLYPSMVNSYSVPSYQIAPSYSNRPSSRSSSNS